MAVTAPGAGGLRSLENLIIRFAKLLKTVIIIAAIGAAAYFIWNHFHNSNNLASNNLAVSNSGLPTPAQVEKQSEKQTASLLSAKDYTSYQIDRQDLAHTYLSSNDKVDAERVMNEVLANVPADKITSSSYSMLFQIEKAKGDISLEKKYLGLMITKLKAEGNMTTASAAQQVLDSLK